MGLYVTFFLAMICFSRLLQMGVFTALALALHNIPEGAATFTGTLSSPKLGATVALAIGIHNIPEGFAVSVPLYFGEFVYVCDFVGSADITQRLLMAE